MALFVADFLFCAGQVEFRKLGWSDRAAICLAVEKTGNIITAAGLIMSISFAGLLIPQTICLNQYGFILFIGVAIDTFIIRTVVVPAVFCMLDKSPMSLLGMCQGTSSPTNPCAGAGAGAGAGALVPVPCGSGEEPDSRSRWDLKVVAANFNWWPTIMPSVVLSEADEKEALLAGYSDPRVFLAAHPSSSASASVKELGLPCPDPSFGVDAAAVQDEDILGSRNIPATQAVQA